MVLFIITVLSSSFLLIAELEFKKSQILKAHPAAIFSVDISSDGYIASATVHNNITIWKRDNDKFSEIQSIETLGINWPICIKFSPDGKLLVVGHSNGLIDIFNASDNWNSSNDSLGSYGNEYQSFTNKYEKNIRKRIWNISFSNNGEYLVTGGSERVIKIYKIINNKYEMLQEISCHFGNIRAIDFSQDEKYFASAAEDGMIFIWKLVNDKFEIIRQIISGSEKVISLSFSPSGKYLVSGDNLGKLKIWIFENENIVQIQSSEEHSSQINSVSFNPEGDLIFTGSSDGTLIIWRFNDNILVKEDVLSSDSNIMSLDISDNGNELIAGGWDGFINVWNLKKNRIEHIQKIVGHLCEINSISFSPNGELFATSGEDRYIKLWKINTDTLTLFQNLRTQKQPIKQIEFNQNGEYLISLGERGSLEVWRKDGNRYSNTNLLDEYTDIESFSFSKENNYLTLSDVFSVQVLRYDDNKFIKLNELDFYTDYKSATSMLDSIGIPLDEVLYCPNSNYLIACGHKSRNISVWNWMSNSVEKLVGPPSENIWNDLLCLSFSVQGNFLIAIDDNYWTKSIKIWKKNDSKFFEFQTFENLGPIQSLCFSPNEEYLVFGTLVGLILTAKNDGSRYDIKISESIKVNEIDNDLIDITNIAFSPDGQYLTFSTDEGEIIIYHVKGLNIPFDEFVKIRISSFLEKDEYESSQEYQNRINQYLDFNVQEIVDYALINGYNIDISDISAYDADNEKYTLYFKFFQPVLISVNRKYAKAFKNDLNKLKIKNPRIKYIDNKLIIAHAEVINPFNQKSFIIGDNSESTYNDLKNNSVSEIKKVQNKSTNNNEQNIPNAEMISYVTDDQLELDYDDIIASITRNKKNIAIMDLESGVISKNDILALNNRFRSEVFKCGKFVVLERERINDILNEQGFQLSGCTSDDCLIEVGKLLSVELIVGGSVNKVGQIFSIDIRLIDVESGRILAVSTEDFKGNIEDLLLYGIRSAVSKLIR
ncbi:MAG: PD40 domain-containing protein [Bacteroidales bacterium]|nr:PD40 domain-containing protein [Bacteroidales bacterium]